MSVVVPRTIRRPLIAASAAAALAAGLAACGSSSGGAGDGDPAAAVPAGAPLYVEAVVRPDGAEGDAAQALLRKVLRTGDPSAKLIALLDDAGSTRGVDFRRDVEPWLGRKAGAGMTRVSAGPGGNGAGLAVIDSRDDAKASAHLDALLGGRTSTARHRDV
ncbi:MAG TPA: hypothetical protein VLB47_13825, partial [Solirubrobacteraceae bacterium]|nr:hypothetical protein [Solirubrobacteraceae bacterium]